MVNLVDALKTNYLEINFESECILRDDGDGVVYIAAWNRPEPQPDEATLLANFDADLYQNQKLWKQQAVDRKTRSAQKTLSQPDSNDPAVLKDKLNAALTLLNLR